MKIYEVTLKEAEAPTQAPQGMDSETFARGLEVVRNKQAGWDAQAKAGIHRGSVEASAMQQGSLPEMGKYLRQQFDMKKKTKLKKTGIKEVDDMLEVMGFII